MTNYITRTLVTRNIDCSNITRDEFVNAMFSDFLEAEEKYNENYIPEWEAWKVKSFEDHMKWAYKSASDYAIKHWKTERKRNEYIDKMVKYQCTYGSPEKENAPVQPMAVGALLAFASVFLIVSAVCRFRRTADPCSD